MKIETNSTPKREDDQQSLENQGIESGNLTNLEEIRSILSIFPNGINHAIGYGSGVFAQTFPPSRSIDEGDQIEVTNPVEKIQSSQNELPMLDLILAVEDPRTFHAQNLSANPNHYSSLMSSLGPNFITWLQCSSVGAKLYFNPLVSVTLPSDNTRKRLIKYGVVSIDDMLRDLKQWEYLYVAGRMQKPTLLIEGDDRILEAQSNCNLKYALSASLLLLSDNKNQNEDDVNSTLSINTVFEQIARLSYSGDPRMAVGGEDPRKVEKLVHSPGQADRFNELYKDQFTELEKMGVLSITSPSNKSNDKSESNMVSNRKIEFDRYDPSTQKLLWKRIPPRLSTNVMELALLGGAIASIVAPAATGQSVKGVLTAGITRSIRYAGAKFAKGWNLKL